ncbi:MAG: bifunctional endo-1,4-beta-xylanase xyla [Hydrogenobaculum sp.]
MANVNAVGAYNAYNVHHHNKVNEQAKNQNTAQATIVNKINEVKNQNTEQNSNQNLQNNPQLTATILNLHR